MRSNAIPRTSASKLAGRVALMIGAALVASTIAGSALAADLPSPMPVPPPVAPLPALINWSGFYGGVNIGGTFSGSNAFATSAAPIFDLVTGGYATTSSQAATVRTAFGKSSFLGGGQVGWNYQFGPKFLVGIETDFQGLAGGSKNVSLTSFVLATGIPGGTVTSFATDHRSLSDLGTLRGRVGYLIAPPFLLYATGGLAYGHVGAGTSIFQEFIPAAGAAPALSSFGGFSDTRVGWTVGAGAEWMFAQNWSAKIEYNYYDLGSLHYSLAALVNQTAVINFASVASSTARFDGHIVRVGLNYHFNLGTPAPVVARY